jgi:hypothetical protein
MVPSHVGTFYSLRAGFGKQKRARDRQMAALPGVVDAFDLTISVPRRIGIREPVVLTVDLVGGLRSW